MLPGLTHAYETRMLCADLPHRDICVIFIDHLDAKKAGELSTLFDVGGIFGEPIPTHSMAYKRLGPRIS